MPIKIYTREDSVKELALLCEDIWELPDQIDALKTWVEENKNLRDQAKIIADISFTPREDASGGGSALESETIKMMADMNIDLYLSEYRK